MNARHCQGAQDRLCPEDVYGVEIEPSAENYVEAEKALGNEFDLLADCLADSSFIPEHAASLYERDANFRAEAIANPKCEEWIDARALELAEKDIEDGRNECRAGGCDSWEDRE